MQLTAFCFLLQLVTLLNFVTLVFRLVLLKRGKRLGTVYLCWNIVLLSLILNGNFSFTYIVERMGKLEDIDVRIFCAAAMDFYRTQVKQVVAARWVSYKPCFPFGLYGVFQNFVTFFFEQRKKCSVVEALQVNNPCLQFFHIHGQFHKPKSSPLLFMTFFRGRGKEGSWFGVVGRRGGGKRLLSMPGVAPVSVLPLFLDRKTVRNLVKIAPEIFFRIKILRISRPFVFILWNWVSSLARCLGSQGCGARLRKATFETSYSS